MLCLAFTNAKKQSKFIFLLPESKCLLDTAKQYFATLRAEKLTNCKSISSILFTEKLSPYSLHLDKECEAQTLQAVRTIPPTCSQRAELNQSGHN